MAGKRYKIQTSKGKGAYTTRFSFPRIEQATGWYNAMATHSGYNKRVVDSETGETVLRYRS